MTRTTLALLLFLAASVTALAADVTGTWKGIFHTREGGEFETILVLKANGDALTGTLTQGKSAARDIEEGKVTGDEISFAITYKSEKATRKLLYTGKLEGNQLKTVSTYEGATRKSEIVFDRQ